MRASRHLGPVLQSAPVQTLLGAIVDRGVSGPSEDDRERGRSFVWGEVADDDGARVVARWSGPEGYVFTADAALRAALRAALAVLNGRAEAGFLTPSLAFGPDFALEMDGTSREDAG